MIIVVLLTPLDSTALELTNSDSTVLLAVGVLNMSELVELSVEVGTTTGASLV